MSQKNNFGPRKILGTKKILVNTSYISQLDFQYVIADYGGVVLVLLVTCVIQTLTL